MNAYRMKQYNALFDTLCRFAVFNRSLDCSTHFHTGWTWQFCRVVTSFSVSLFIVTSIFTVFHGIILRELFGIGGSCKTTSRKPEIILHCPWFAFLLQYSNRMLLRFIANVNSAHLTFLGEFKTHQIHQYSIPVSHLNSPSYLKGNVVFKCMTTTLIESFCHFNYIFLDGLWVWVITNLRWTVIERQCFFLKVWKIWEQ